MRKNFFTATLIAVALLLWLGSGLLFQSEGQTEHPTLAQSLSSTASQSPGAAARVRVEVIEAVNRPRVVTLRGRTQTKRSVEVKAEVAGKIVARPVERGQQVGANDLLCKIAVDDRNVLVTQAQAALEEARIEYQGSLKLKEQGLQSQTAIARANARLEAARAAVRQRLLKLERTNIVAPFDGFIESLPMNVGDYAVAGSVCATVVDPDPMLVSAQVTESEVERLGLGSPVTGVTTTGQELEGSLTFIARQSEPSTRTYPVEITVDNKSNVLRSGLTVSLQIKLEEVPAHKVSPALLALTDSGELGLRSVSEDSRVEFYQVTIIEDSSDGVWVTGLPATTRLITVGQEYVHAGQLVDAVDAGKNMP